MTLANSSAYLIAHAARHALCRLDLDLGSDALTGRVSVSSTRESDSSAGGPPKTPAGKIPPPRVHLRFRVGNTAFKHNLYLCDYLRDNFSPTFCSFQRVS